MNAERAYVFRHALLRDAAYQLHLPGDRARLHGLAFAAMEDLAGGRPPDATTPDAAGRTPHLPHATDPFAEELARHAAMSGVAAVVALRRVYLRRAAEHSEAMFRNEEAMRLWQESAEAVAGSERGLRARRDSSGWCRPASRC